MQDRQFEASLGHFSTTVSNKRDKAVAQGGASSCIFHYWKVAVVSWEGWQVL